MGERAKRRSRVYEAHRCLHQAAPIMATKADALVMGAMFSPGMATWWWPTLVIGSLHCCLSHGGGDGFSSAYQCRSSFFDSGTPPMTAMRGQ